MKWLILIAGITGAVVLGLLVVKFFPQEFKDSFNSAYESSFRESYLKSFKESCEAGAKGKADVQKIQESCDCATKAAATLSLEAMESEKLVLDAVRASCRI